MKKFSFLFFAFVFIFSFFIQSTKAQAFTDLDSSHRFYEEINYLTERDIITGFKDNSFRPNGIVTRAQAAIMVGRALDLNGEPKDTKFTDVKASITGSGYIASAVERGIIQGFPDNTFRPDQPVTRGQMAIFIARAFNLEEQSNTSFSDVSTSMSAYIYIKQIIAEGITAGYPDGTFRPNVQLKRSDFSAFLARALDDKFKVPIPSNNLMKAHFIDVGQGDSSLIITPNGSTILIDGGRHSAGEKVVSYLKAAGISSIDLLVATHPDADHIGGLLDVLQEIPVKNVLDSGREHTTQTYLDYLTIIDNKNIPFHVGKTGETISLDPSLNIQILNSGDNGATDNNEASVVLKVSYNQVDFLFTGDAGIEAEEKMLPRFNLNAEILKVSHHGSNTGTSTEFLNEVRPKVSILSYGDNSYGHPSSEVINKLKTVGSSIYSTMDQGNITVTTNGNTYSVSVKPWQNGTTPTPTPEPTPEPTPTPAPAPKVSIISVDKANEVVKIKNNGTTSVNMTGWKLVSVEGSQTYTFPSSYLLKAGGTVSVTSGPNAVHNPPTYLKWTGAYIWNNSGDPAKLLNDKGVVISEFR